MTISATTQGIRPGVCTSSNRPATPFEGQMIYETDTDVLAIWNGSAWRIIGAAAATSGSVLQIQSITKTDRFTTSSTSYVDVTGLSVSITPKSATSKIFVLFSGNGSGATGAAAVHLRMMRGATAINVGDAGGSRTQATTGGISDSAEVFGMSSIFLDSPATTSATTYSIQVRSNGTGIAINGAVTDTDIVQRARTTSTITVMEIAG